MIGLWVAGLIAYEAVRQLRQAGEPVALPVSTGDVVLLESEVLPLADFVDPTMGWSDRVKGQLLHYRLPGTTVCFTMRARL